MFLETKILLENIYNIDTNINIEEFIFYSNKNNSKFIINETNDDYQLGIYFDNRIQKVINKNQMPHLLFHRMSSSLENLLK